MFNQITSTLVVQNQFPGFIPILLNKSFTPLATKAPSAVEEDWSCTGAPVISCLAIEGQYLQKYGLKFVACHSLVSRFTIDHQFYAERRVVAVRCVDIECRPEEGR